MTKQEEAGAYFLSGFCCSQAVLYVFAEELGIPKQAALKLADAFCGGMGTGNTCGAVTAAYMVIGLRHGRTEPEENSKKEETRRLVKLFSEEFYKLNGALNCSDLLECDMATVEGRKTAKDSGLFVEACPKYVQSAVILLEKLLEVNGPVTSS